MNWNAYNNRELAIVLWSDGSHNTFFASDEHMCEFISQKEQRDQLTYKIEKCQHSEYDVKYNNVAHQKAQK
jgi:hypothetical protein